MKDAKPLSLYAFEPEVEQAIVYACCTKPRFYSVIGAELEADRMRDKTAREIISSVHVLAKKNGTSPTWAQAVVQHVATLMSRGKATLEQLEAIKDYLVDAGENFPDSPIEELVSVTVPIVQRVKHRAAVDAAIGGFKDSGDPESVARAFDAVAKLGKGTGAGTASSVSQLAESAGFFAPRKKEDSLRLGVDELDSALGGIERQSLTLLVGGSGSGKSMALSHVAVTNYLDGHSVYLLTLEMSKERVGQRVARNLTGMTRREYEQDPSLARARLAAVESAATGELIIDEDSPLTTSPALIKAKVLEAERKSGRHFDVFVIDFADKIRVNPRATQYEDMLAVIDQLRQIAVDANGWTITASQADRKSTNRPWVDLDAVADSMNKIRSADTVIGIGRTEEDAQSEQIRFLISKRRDGEGAGGHIGPLPWDADHGRISVVTDRAHGW